MPRVPVARAAPLLAGCAALALTGCGSGRRPTPEGLRLQRQDLVASARARATAQSELDAETRATQAAWPLVYRGLPASLAGWPPAAVSAAAKRATAVRMPALFAERPSRLLTGEAATLAGDFRSFATLTGTGWRMILYDAGQIEHGTPAAAAFARGNVDLYVESVYDGQFDIAQIGRKLKKAWQKLGGEAAFGGALTQAEVQQLADSYSEPGYRLQPHSDVKYGT